MRDNILLKLNKLYCVIQYIIDIYICNEANYKNKLEEEKLNFILKRFFVHKDTVNSSECSSSVSIFRNENFFLIIVVPLAFLSSSRIVSNAWITCFAIRKAI